MFNIFTEINLRTNNEVKHRLVVKAIKCKMGPKVLAPSLMEFGVLLSFPSPKANS